MTYLGLGAMNAGEVLLAAAHHKPCTVEEVIFGRGPIIRLDALVIDVRAAFFNRAAGCTLGISEARSNEQVNDSERRSEEHTSELQSRFDLVCRLLLEKKKTI